MLSVRRVAAIMLASTAIPLQLLTSAAVAEDFTISTVAATMNGGYTIDGGDTLTISADGGISHSSGGKDAVRATGAGNVITNNGYIFTTAGASDGMDLSVDTGDITVLGGGNITTQGGNSNGVRVGVTTGNAMLSFGDVTTSGGSARGITTGITTGNATITAGDITTTNGNAQAISVAVGTGSIGLTLGDVTTTGASSHGIVAGVTGTGDVTITAGDVQTAGNSAKAISATVGTGDVTIDVNDVTTTGISQAIYATATAGDITITAHDVSTERESSDAIYATTGTGDIVTTVNDVTTKRSGSYGIYNTVNGVGNVTITANDVNVEGPGVSGVIARTKTGTVTVSAHDVSTNGNGAVGIDAQVQTSGSSIVSANSVATMGDGSEGIISKAAGTGSSTVTVASVTTTGLGAQAINSSAATGTNTIRAGYVQTDGLGAEGISATVATGTNDIELTEGLTKANGGDVISAWVTGSGTNLAHIGDVTTLGDGADVFYGHFLSGSNEVHVDGALVTSGAGGKGVWAEGVNGNNLVDVEGSIVTRGSSAYGVQAAISGAGDNTIAVDGSIETWGNGSIGVLATTAAGDNFVTITGSITTHGDGAHGVLAQLSGSGDNVITNYGTVTTAGANAYALYADPPSPGTTNTINNYGSAISLDSYAIKFDDSDLNTLNMYAGSVLVGAVDLQYLDVLNIETSPTMSVFWDFSSLPDGVVPTVTGGSPYVFNATDKTFATIDPGTVATISPAMLADYAQMAATLFGRTGEPGAWFRHYGGTMSYDGANGSATQHDVQLSGAAMGVDVDGDAGRSYGAIMGYGTGAIDFTNDLPASSADGVEGMFVGLRASQDLEGWTVGLSVTGGINNHTHSRVVNDSTNLDPDTLGTALASAEYRGWWLDPRLELAHELQFDGGLVLTPRLSASYAAEYVDAYTETGTVAPMSVASRTVAMGQLEASIAAEQQFGDLQLSAEIGYRYRTDFSEAAEVTLIGEAIELSSDFGDSSAVYATVGAELLHADAISLGVKATAMQGTDGFGSSVQGALGIRF